MVLWDNGGILKQRSVFHWL